MAERVTLQDIADALGISRNTVSKAINNTGVIADATRTQVLKKAQEMGYKQFAYMTLPEEEKPRESASPGPLEKSEISLFFRGILGSSHFSLTMMDRFQHELSRQGYALSMHRLMEEDIREMSLPSSFSPDRSAGIVCVEIFDRAYVKMLSELPSALLIVDGPPLIQCGEPLADRLLMNNRRPIYEFVRAMHGRGKRQFGFVGDALHCQSFYERFSALEEMTAFLNLPAVRPFSILDNEYSYLEAGEKDYPALIGRRVREMAPNFPEVFLCANDFVAVLLLQALRTLGLRVPEDICLCGFDDIPESRLISPQLTTVHIHSQIMGVTACRLLTGRIRHPEFEYVTAIAETDLLFRASTGDT